MSSAESPSFLPSIWAWSVLSNRIMSAVMLSRSRCNSMLVFYLTRQEVVNVKKTPVSKGKEIKARRWFNFGPGIAIALILSAFVVYTRWQEQARRTPPRIERTVLSDSTKPDEGIIPEISSLLSRREELKLSAQQVKQIEKLQAEWERVATPLREQANRAAGQFRAWMDEAQKRGRVAMNEVQERGAEVRELSAQLVQQRRAYWQSALKLLTEEQRAQVERMRDEG